MKKLFISFLLLTLTLSMQSVFTDEVKRHGSFVIHSVADGDFTELAEAVKLTIEGRGLVISYTSYPERMFKRTAKVLGDKPPVFKNAISYLFCKASTTDDLVRKDPHLLPLCPYSINVYQLTADPDVIYISYLSPQTEAEAFKAINALINSIITEAVEF